MRVRCLSHELLIVTVHYRRFYEYLSFIFIFQPEEKSKFDGIFESLAPVNGLLSGDKVKPVLINSKLPVDVLGKVTFQ